MVSAPRVFAACNLETTGPAGHLKQLAPRVSVLGQGAGSAGSAVCRAAPSRHRLRRGTPYDRSKEGTARADGHCSRLTARQVDAAVGRRLRVTCLVAGAGLRRETRTAARGSRSARANIMAPSVMSRRHCRVAGLLQNQRPCPARRTAICVGRTVGEAALVSSPLRSHAHRQISQLPRGITS